MNLNREQVNFKIKGAYETISIKHNKPLIFSAGAKWTKSIHTSK